MTGGPEDKQQQQDLNGECGVDLENGLHAVQQGQVLALHLEGGGGGNTSRLIQQYGQRIVVAITFTSLPYNKFRFLTKLLKFCVCLFQIVINLIISFRSQCVANIPIQSLQNRIWIRHLACTGTENMISNKFNGFFLLSFFNGFLVF